MHLSRFDPVRFAHLPTPLEPLPGLTTLLAGDDGSGPTLWIKRDDCTGLAGGGNKTRKLEYLLGAALSDDADTLVTQGAIQSNHVRQTAAAAARFGLACEIILEARTGSNAIDYNRSGNVLLDELLGARVRTVPGGSDMAAELARAAAEVEARGGRPYVIPGGGSNAVGALGYAECARELVAQADEMGLVIDRIVVASGSAGTHAGLVAGLAVMGADIPVLGIGVRAAREPQEANVYRLARETAALLGHEDRVTREMVVADCDYVGAGYGLIDEGVIDTLKTLARLDAILLDPVYTAKAMKGLIARARAGDFEGETVVFLHTGGAQGLFGYQSELEGRLG
jgi:L-cysteate sulfo-lyase